ncbi:TPA: hypothetical protein ACMDT4_004023 [Vibrio parahaemolyticus]
MLNRYNVDELKALLKKNDVSVSEHEFIIRQIEYGMWEFKVRESNANQRSQLKLIEKSATSLLKKLKSLSWELSSELHDQLNDEYTPELIWEDEDEEFEVEDIDSKFKRALEANADSLTLQNIYDEGLEEAFNEVPIDGAANALDYLNKLVSACNVLIDRKAGNKDKELYQAFQSQWDMIGEKHSIEINKTNSIEFISVCLGKDVETVKKQYLRLGIRPFSLVESEFTEIMNLENLILDKYQDEWHRLTRMPKFADSGVNANVHWVLVDSFQKRKLEYSDFKEYLQFLDKEGIGDIIEKYE